MPDDTSKPHLYRVTYSHHLYPEGLTREQIDEMQEKDPDLGACDALVMFSLLYPEDGSYSWLMIPRDGRTGKDLSDAEVWKCWAMLAHRLSMSETLSPGKKELCREVHEAVKETVRRSRGRQG